jgi:hypothetical protein
MIQLSACGLVIAWAVAELIFLKPEPWWVAMDLYILVGGFCAMALLGAGLRLRVFVVPSASRQNK